MAECCYQTAVTEMAKEHPDRCKALWHLDCAINLNPQFLEAINLKEELNGKLAEFATTVDNLEEVFENREQIEISKFYERMPKPTTTAIEEFLEGKLMYRIREEEEPKPDA